MKQKRRVSILFILAVLTVVASAFVLHGCGKSGGVAPGVTLLGGTS